MYFDRYAWRARIYVWILHQIEKYVYDNKTNILSLNLNQLSWLGMCDTAYQDRKWTVKPPKPQEELGNLRRKRNENPLHALCSIALPHFADGSKVDTGFRVPGPPLVLNLWLWHHIMAMLEPGMWVFFFPRILSQ